jgi:hypothetical protein
LTIAGSQYEESNRTYDVFEIIKERNFRNKIQKASYDEEFRIIVKLSHPHLINQFKEAKKNIYEFNSYSGIAITLSKKELLEKLKFGYFTEVWSNSEIKAASSYLSSNALNLSQTVCNFTEKVSAPSLWADGLYGNNTRISILDTGIKISHPALAETMEGESRILATRNFFDNTTNVEDDHGHGTEVAGVIGSNGLNGYMRGIAPNCYFLIGKVLTHEATGSIELLIKGIDWSLENNADVINLSLGKVVSDKDAPEVVAVNNAVKQGVIVCVSAGNARGIQEFGYNDFYTLLSPGIATQAITVGAIDNNNVLYDLSGAGPVVQNYNQTSSQFIFDSIENEATCLKPDLVAPGVMLNTTATNGDNTKVVSGTSYSAAVVSGICSLLIQDNSLAKPSLVKASFLETSAIQTINFVSPLGTLISHPIDSSIQGAGLVNALQAFNFIEDPPNLTIWPSRIPFTDYYFFRNRKNSFFIHLFVNEAVVDFNVEIPSYYSKIFDFSDIPSDPDVGQYDIPVTMNTEDDFIGLHTGSVLFNSNNISTPLSLRYETILLRGRNLIICNEIGTENLYSLFGTVRSVIAASKMVGLEPIIFERDIDFEELSSRNLNDYEVITIINHNKSNLHTFTEDDFSALSDYILPNGNYKGGSLIILPSTNSDLTSLNNLLNPFNISYETLSIVNETIDLASISHILVDDTNVIDEIFIPHPLNVSKENDAYNSIANRFVYSENRYDNGSLIIACNNIEMFLSSPYIYSNSVYNELLLASDFGDNFDLLENIYTNSIGFGLSFEYNLSSTEIKENENLVLRINANNYFKPLTNWDFYISFELEDVKFLEYSTYTDFENGTYEFSFRPIDLGIKPGKYYLAIRSSSNKNEWEIHILARVSWGPIIVELSILVCIVFLLTYRKKKPKM